VSTQGVNDEDQTIIGQVGKSHPAASWQRAATGMAGTKTSCGRLEDLPYGRLAACRYGLAISKKWFLFLCTAVFAACGWRAIMEV
jgi:hypothetical protein